MTGRPVAPLFEALRQGGAGIAFEGDAGCFTGDSFVGGRLRMSGRVSSQFISGMLLGAAQSHRGVELTVEGGIVQSAFVGITLAAMRHFGAAVEADTGLEHFTVAPTGYRAHDMVVDADASTATYFAALTAVTGGRVSLTNLTPDTLQPDYGFMALLERLGCSVTSGATGTTVASGGTRPGALRGGFTADMRPLSDAVPTLAAIAPFADSPITIAGVEHIRHHECDASTRCADR
jgi:3-phosphoshikimate 1-carboxyvinyltransferase